MRTEKTHDQRKNNLLSLFIKCPPVAGRKNKRVVLNLRTGKTVEEVEPLHTLDDRFTENDGFFKCHRSYLVYMPNVDRFGTTELRMKSGSSIPIARGYGKAFKEAYFSMMFRD